MNAPEKISMTVDDQQLKEIDDNKPNLLHLSDISLYPVDIRHIEWNKTQALSGKTVTRVQTRYTAFLLESDSPNYQADIEALKEAIGKS